MWWIRVTFRDGEEPPQDPLLTFVIRAWKFLALVVVVLVVGGVLDLIGLL